jgi:hypothetical protein
MTELGVTGLVSGLSGGAEVPAAWSAVEDQAILLRSLPGSRDTGGQLTELLTGLALQASWIHLNIGTDGTLPGASRFDAVLWVAGGRLPADAAIRLWIDTVTRHVDPMDQFRPGWTGDPLMVKADPWTAELTPRWYQWPGGWHPIERNDQLAITCTRRALAAVRVWFVASTVSYLDAGGGRSLSGLIETDDERGTRGALAAYVGYLARERRHRLAGMLISGIADLKQDPVEHAVELAKLREVETDISVTAVNVSGEAARLAAWLGPSGPAGWMFLKADDRDIEVSLATATGNAGRASAVQDRLRAMQQHSDSIAQQAEARANTAETRANTYATLLLTVVAGAFTGAALAATHKLAVSIVFGCGLFTVGLLIADATRGYLRIHRLLCVIVMAGAGAAWSLTFNKNHWVTAVAAPIGAALGLGLFYVAATLQRGSPRSLIKWLTGPLRKGR